MNTNSNTYTVIYTSLVVVVVAAVLAFVSQTLKPKQDANDKAETISQILTAGQFASKDSLASLGNTNIINMYKENIQCAYCVNVKGDTVKVLDSATAEVYSVSDLKKENYSIQGKNGQNPDQAVLPVYVFKNGTIVMPIYGAGLWGPVWGYMAFEQGTTNIKGAYFDHASETPGLGGKIQEDPDFRAQFIGKQVIYTEGADAFEIVKGGAGDKANGVDAITGATMTSKGLNAAINTWLEAYKAVLGVKEAPCCEGECCAHECCGKECCGECCTAEVEPSNTQED